MLSSFKLNSFLVESVSKNLMKSCTFKVLGIVFSYTISDNEVCVSSSESITLVCGKSMSQTLAILGNAMKFTKIVKTNMFQKFFKKSIFGYANIQRLHSKTAPDYRFYLNFNKI